MPDLLTLTKVLKPKKEMELLYNTPLTSLYGSSTTLLVSVLKQDSMQVISLANS